VVSRWGSSSVAVFSALVRPRQQHTTGAALTPELTSLLLLSPLSCVRLPQWCVCDV
jgi:hypothetical protein